MARIRIHPVEILAAELNELQSNAAQLSSELGSPTNPANQIIAGTRGISATSAVHLGQWFEMRPGFWLNLPPSYELRLAEREANAENWRTTPAQEPAGGSA